MTDDPGMKPVPPTVSRWTAYDSKGNPHGGDTAEAAERKASEADDPGKKTCLETLSRATWPIFEEDAIEARRELVRVLSAFLERHPNPLPKPVE